LQQWEVVPHFKFAAVGSCWQGLGGLIGLGFKSYISHSPEGDVLSFVISG